ncbi:MAG: DUF3309 domain-containing protein [Betaproteobacteria bacterium]|nr:DUF3309 domain-containing protein [Betaproteobacteria bacterium]
MSIGTILLIVLVLALIGVIPAWPHAQNWGYGPRKYRPIRRRHGSHDQGEGGHLQ